MAPEHERGGVVLRPSVVLCAINQGGPDAPPLDDLFKEILDKGREIFEPKYGRPLSDHEMQEITNHLVGVTRSLLKWEGDRLEREAAAAEGGASAGADEEE